MTNKIFEKLKAAKEAFDKAAEEYQKLSKEIEEALADRPRVIFNKKKLKGCLEECLLCASNDITYYYKYSDEYIEFETDSCKFRYLKVGQSNTWEYPKKDKSSCTLITNSADVFQIYDFACRKWTNVDYIERIELLEGVTEYDKNRKR